MSSKYILYAKNFSLYFGASLIPMILSLFTNPWIAQNMSPEDYAITGYYTSFSSLISPIIIFYLIHYYIKEYFRRTEIERRKLFATIAKATIWFSGIVSILCFVIILIYQKYINKDLSLPIMPYLALMVFALPLTGLLNLQLAEFRMEKKANAYFKLSICNGLLNVFLSLILVVWLKLGAFGKLLAPLICNGLVFTYLLIRLKSIFAIKTTFQDFKIIFKFCLPLAASAMLGYFTNGFSTTYLESTGEVTEYGIYVVGASIGAYLIVFSTAIGNTFQPDLYETVINKSWKKYAWICLLEIGSVTLIAICFIILAPFIIDILTAGRYTASTVYAQIISVSTVTSCIYFLINQFSIATNRPKLYLYTSILGSIAVVAGMKYAVDNWLFIGGAWMTVLSFMIFTVINIFLLFISKIGLLPRRYL